MTEEVRAALEASGVPYAVLPHPIACTAEETAALEHVPGAEVAKVVVCAVGDGAGWPLLAVVPAPWRVHLATLARLVGAPTLRLATEAEVAALFPRCEAGAMPALGEPYGVPLWVDQRLAACPEIVFNAGTHDASVRMAWADYAQLARPHVGDFAVRHEDA